MLTALRGQFGVVTTLRQCAVALQNMEQEEAEPHALAAAFQTYHIHTVVPVTGPHQRQAMLTKGQPVLQRPHAMLVQRLLYRTRRRLFVRGFLARRQFARLQIAHLFFQNGLIVGGVQVVANRQRQPQIVIRTARAYAIALRRMPPVLYVAFDKLA
ncbi:hypothetical protein D3C78_1400300 [compost metagenome]